MSSPLSFDSTSQFRNKLIVKNLQPYNVPGVFSPVTGSITYQASLSDYIVKDSPENPQDAITSDFRANQAYVLNEYGPNAGFTNTITYNGPIIQNDPNQGEYLNNRDTRLDLVNEQNIDAAYLENAFGPVGGFEGLVTVTDIQLLDKIHQPYWEPPSFESSTYSAYDLVFVPNPNGSSGPLSNDSFIAKLGADRFKFSFEERIATETLLESLAANPANLVTSPYEASLVATGQQPFVGKNYKITIPENELAQNDSLQARLQGTYTPFSPIPGDYFDENTFGGRPTNQTSTALSVFNQATGNSLGPILNTRRNPSQIFLANTGSGQRFTLFNNISMNRFQPGYDKSLGGLNRLVEGVAQNALELLGLSEDRGGYYVGSPNSEPGQIESPPNQIPVDPFGRQILATVYGPQEVAQLFEGNISKIQFGLAARPAINGGGTSGSFVWTTKKTKGGAGKHASIGGGVGRSDGEYNLISSDYTKNESTTFNFKKTSILDQTQRLVESADNVSGIQRLKHVGNAINQVSKVFNDGYKEITKGSRVIYYYDSVTKKNTMSKEGQEVGVEYCRLFTKDTPYYTYNDLQKSDGVTKQGRSFSYSVLDNTFNLNIAPLRGPDSTNIAKDSRGRQYAKKYMFSIENLAWRTSDREGYRYDDLPACERGPNGGRIMWFPPYDLTFNDTSNAGWQTNEFIGRPEPIYTYKNTTRQGSISFKIIVDSPSVLNLLVDEQLKGVDNQKVDSILNSFFAGCIKYDLYTLAKKFNMFKSSELQELQEEVSKSNLKADDLQKILKEIPLSNIVEDKNNVPNNDQPNNVEEKDPRAESLKTDFPDFSFYFEHAVPSINDKKPFDELVSSYLTDANITKYTKKADVLFDIDVPNRQVGTFFTDFVKNNWDTISKGAESLIERLKPLLKEGYTIEMDMLGSASADGSTTSNQALSERRIESVRAMFEKFGLKEYFGKTFFVRSIKGEGEKSVAPKSTNGTQDTVDCTKDILDVNGGKGAGSQIFSVDAMACRRVTIKNIVVKGPEIKKQVVETVTPKEKSQITPTQNEPKGPNNTTPIIPQQPTPIVTVNQKLKAGIGKKILRRLLSECNYFDVLKERTPFIYDSLREKIKYFNPAFHSMTPEGLNSRLTFLNQCVRPGQTIPVIDPKGRPIYNDALNTSFGTPPVLVLRIGDFYHTKVVADSVQITYDPLLYDINPEGIGVQPMIAKVTMNIKFIGGHGLAKPVEQLQNALSFNFYANTEMYDERAVFTEDTSTLDREIFDSIVDGEKKATINDAAPQPDKRGLKAIGDISTNVPVTGGETGFTSFQKIMTTTNSVVKDYFNTVVNFGDKILKQNNYGMWLLVLNKTQFNKGNLKYYQSASPFSPSNKEIYIVGKPFDVQKRLEDLLAATIKDIKEGLNNYIIQKMVGYDIFKPSDIEVLRANFIDYLTQVANDLQTGLLSEVQTFTTYQQDMVQNFRKLNVVNSNTDGKILETGMPFVYTLSPTTEIGKGNPANILDTLQQLSDDYTKVGIKFEEFDVFLTSEISDGGYPLLPSGTRYYEPDGDNIGYFTQYSSKLSKIPDQRLFILMSQIFDNKDKFRDFQAELLNSGLNKINKFPSKLESACEEFRDIVKDELSKERDMIRELKSSGKFKDFVKKNIFDPTRTRKCTYTTVPDQANLQNQEKLVKDVWSDVNVDTDTKTWEGKIEFN